MGLFQWAVETYDRNENIAGKMIEGKIPLAPIGHILTEAKIEITVDKDGNIKDARRVDKDEGKILIPVTEDSAGRTVDPRAHPLCEQLGYLMPSNEKKYKLYLDQLREWCNSEMCTEKLLPILKYVEKGKIISDLQERKIIDTDYKNDEKSLVRWRVSGLGEENSGSCWTDKKLFSAYEAFCKSKKEKEGESLCVVTGEYQSAARQHAKGVVSFNGNAKIVSSNDSQGFTYRGRFVNDQEALGIGYITSQKAHNAIRWLVDNQKVTIGGRTYICWCPEGVEIPRCTHQLKRKDQQEEIAHPSDYKQKLREALNSWSNELSCISRPTAVIVSFDAATTGRLAVTYYQELAASDFLERLYDWDESCVWMNGVYGVQSPYLGQIVRCAYGTERNGKLDVDDRLLGEQMQRLVRCRIDKAAFPLNIERMLVQKASSPQIYKEEKNWRTVLFTACAAVRKYHYDHEGGEINMALDVDSKDRSYQFGRLLAVLEKIERDTYKGEAEREPNALRRLPVFCKRPYHTFVQLEQMMEQAYIPRLHPAARIKYKQLMGDILKKMEEAGVLSEEKRNRPLEDTYLIGYYLQREALYPQKSGAEKTDDEEEDEV